jgi:hypothetical protein
MVLYFRQKLAVFFISYRFPIPDSRLPIPDSHRSFSYPNSATPKFSMPQIKPVFSQYKDNKKKLKPNDLKNSKLYPHDKPKSRTYDRAVELLVNLRDLAAEENKFEPFQTKLDLIYDNYGNRHSLIKRLCKVRLDRS